MEQGEEETEECIRKVKERKMGYLFENAEKMDIQAERRKTAEALRRLEEAEQKAIEAEQKAKEQTVEAMIEYAQELGAGEEQIIKKVIEKFNMTQQEAEQKVKMYRKE